MRLTRSGGQAAAGPQEWFTGTVFIDGIRTPDEQSAVGCAHVRFAPAHVPPGTTTPRARPSTSLTASGTSPAAAGRSRRSAPATSSTSTWRGALARRHTGPVHGSHRDPGGRRERRRRHLARARHRRRPPKLTPAPERTSPPTPGSRVIGCLASVAGHFHEHRAVDHARTYGASRPPGPRPTPSPRPSTATSTRPSSTRSSRSLRPAAPSWPRWPSPGCAVQARRRLPHRRPPSPVT